MNESRQQTGPVHAARILLERRLLGEQGPALPVSCRPTSLQAAFDIQCAVSDLVRDLHHQDIAGWKCGMPADDKWVLAPIYANDVHEASAQTHMVWSDDRDNRDDRYNQQVKIEPELAFILRHDLPARATPYTAAEVDAAIDETRLALELIHTRYANADQLAFCDHLADCLFNQGLVLGPRVDHQLAGQTRSMPISIKVASEAAVILDGQHPAGQPRLPLYWLAEFLRSQGMGLRAGQAIITGSYAGSPQVPLNTDISVQFGNLGLMQLRFAKAHFEGR
ncbi:fumarylacetoacetate hydrolase family protein [Undibacterium sp. CY18W]|uniref:Fumarylacetoacetate hydrolase family protein n=1 Tax=Undibacterium hunanense TaxID=2762292 RepID=A0ABR6ZPR6_9BURK|nr:fumarylacetoacetate hydrolase family protein [Undibacterium hunanense]MBC3917870.1 fumarylacetoacetate hydrolase family protein [Undibacterium hunanense]